MRNDRKRTLRTLCALAAVALLAMALPTRMAAQDDDDDPPGRAARLGHIDGEVSFQPAGETEWVETAPNRPMTTGDKLWADHDSRAEIELGSIIIRLAGNTGFSFLNLDDRTTQIQLSSGILNLRVRRLSDDDVLEVDTPNQAFSIYRPGQYRIEASDDGTYTVVTVREGKGESTGNGQTFTVHEGQSATFSGTDRLNAEIQDVGAPDDFDRWCDRRDQRFEESRTAHYVSPDVVGAEDLDEYGDWQPSPEYGNVWYPRVPVGWAPYHTGHWAWIDPWGWTWVDDSPWGYAPFHYGRWVNVYGRWGWIPGPIEAHPVYAPALVVFVGGGGPAMGGNVAWFPLGPREVYVPSYHVSQGYVNRVNISNTTVNVTQVTNVYNTTIINKTTVVNNVTYVNRNVSGAVTAVPQQAFAAGQSVERAAVPVSRQQLARASVSARVAVSPAPTAVLGVRAHAGGRVAAPPAAVLNRPVMARTAPPPAPVSFAVKQQMLAAHPGQPVARQQLQQLRPANAPSAQPMVRQVTPNRPAPVGIGGPARQPVNGTPVNSPAETSHFQPPVRNDRPAPAQPNNRPEVNPAMANQPQPNQPPSRPAEPNRPYEPPARNDHPVAPTPVNRPAQPIATPRNERPAEPSRPIEAPLRPQPAPVATPQPHPSQPAVARPAPQPQSAPKPQTKDEKKH
jgi:hypothetical protein